MWVNKLKVGTLIKPQAHTFCFIRSQDFLEAGAVSDPLASKSTKQKNK